MGRPCINEAARTERLRKRRIREEWRDRWVSDIAFDQALTAWLRKNPELYTPDEETDQEDEEQPTGDAEAAAMVKGMCPQDFKFRSQKPQ